MCELGGAFASCNPDRHHDYRSRCWFLRMAAAIFPRRLAALTKLRCSIFQTAYNPTSIRTGAKYLRARLRGPSMLNYYPMEISIAKLRKGTPDWDVEDYDELARLADVEFKKKRGKGAPKKAKTKGAYTVCRFAICQFTEYTYFQLTVGEPRRDGSGVLLLMDLQAHIHVRHRCCKPLSTFSLSVASTAHKFACPIHLYHLYVVRELGSVSVSQDKGLYWLYSRPQPTCPTNISSRLQDI